MVKNYVLDTNVLIHDPNSIFRFEDNIVIIPFPVLEEIDKLKTRGDKVGGAAREVNRILDKMREKGDLNKGIKVDNGGMIKVVAFEREELEKIPKYLGSSTDDWILAYTLLINKQTDKPTFLVTKDINLRVKAGSIGINAQDYMNDQVDITTLLLGYREINVEIDLDDEIPLEKLNLENKPFPNEYFDINNGNLYRFDSQKNKLVKLNIDYSTYIFGITPRNREQIFALDALLNDDIKLVSLVGIAGTGKTLLALAAGLKKVMEEKIYTKLLVSKPVVPVGKDIGYLPGKIEEKMRPWLQPIFDNLEFLFTQTQSQKRLKEILEKKEILEIEVLSYIRGRSIPDQFIIIDEVQNLTPHEIKTVITRVGENTKIVLTGDPYQIDSPYLTTHSNGLVHVASKMIDSDMSAHIVLTKGERSKLATLAADLL